MCPRSDEFELRKFVAPEFVFGVGARHLVGRYARNLHIRKALVVTDPGVMAAGWTSSAVSSLEAEHIPHVAFSQVTTNPKSEEVMLGAEVYRREDCDAIVAVGGGSPIDCAKGIGIVTSNDKHILDFEGVDEVPFPGPPLLCIPTTAGSSADVSQFAIITDRKQRVKITIISKTLVPDISLVDPETTVTMDPRLTADTGMDALVHAIEAFVSDASSPITDVHALEAIRLVSANLVLATKDPADLVARRNMMLASLHAGLAFSNASLGAVHALAHSMGGLLDTYHGESNAILLKHVVDFNFEAAAPRYFRIGEALGLDHVEESTIIAEIGRLQKEVGLDRTLSEIGVQRSDIPDLALKAMQDACMITNPHKMTRRDVEEIYERAL